MLPPFLKILFNEPGLLTEHIAAYSSLLTKDAHLWQANMQRRLVLKLIMASSFFLAFIFAGIALMVGGATGNTHWSLWVVPLLPSAVTVISMYMLTNKESQRKPFEASKKQICADIRMFQERI